MSDVGILSNRIARALAHEDWWAIVGIIRTPQILCGYIYAIHLLCVFSSNAKTAYLLMSVVILLHFIVVIDVFNT